MQLQLYTGWSLFYKSIISTIIHCVNSQTTFPKIYFNGAFSWHALFNFYTNKNYFLLLQSVKQYFRKSILDNSGSRKTIKLPLKTTYLKIHD